MKDKNRIAAIINWINRVETSNMSISKFFETESVPFSRVQYYNYRRQLRESGLARLKDQRLTGGNRKISLEQEAFLRGCINQNPDVSLEQLQQALREEFSCILSVSAVSRALLRIDPNIKRNIGRPPKRINVVRMDSNALGLHRSSKMNTICSRKLNGLTSERKSTNINPSFLVRVVLSTLGPGQDTARQYYLNQETI